MLNRKAQVGMEYLILMGFLTVVITTILGIGLYYSTTAEDSIRSSQIYNFGNKITGVAESVYYAGYPSKATINPFLPEGVTNITNITTGTVYDLMINITLPTGNNTMSFRSQVPIKVYQSATQPRLTGGIVTVTLEAIAGNNPYVNISIK
jgi:hypothetical protein